MKTALATVILMLSFTRAESRVGMSEIQFKTPGGHIICDCDPYTETPVLTGYDSSVKNLREWYFYKNHIIGYGDGYYFIFDEARDKLQVFKDKADWEQAILSQHLKPVFIRWLDISDSIEAFYAAIVYGMIIWIPLIFVIGIAGFMFFYVKGFNKRKLIVVGLLLLSVIMALLYRTNIHSF